MKKKNETRKELRAAIRTALNANRIENNIYSEIRLRIE